MKTRHGAVLDHITIVAPTLSIGARFVQDTLGVDMQQGGSHPRMGTHNLLLSLGPSLFLEVIAIDSTAPKPPRPRWFGLDARPAHFQPCLAAWVVRTQNIHASSAHCCAMLGEVEPMSRGALSWLITILPNGALPMDGAAPLLIEWHADAHPAKSLNDSGCSLVELMVFHPEPQKVRPLIDAIGLMSPPPVRPSPDASLVAHIQTPRGLRSISVPSNAPSSNPRRID